MRRNNCKGILLREIILTHVLHDSFAYEVTGVVAACEGRVIWTGDNMI